MERKSSKLTPAERLGRLLAPRNAAIGGAAILAVAAIDSRLSPTVISAGNDTYQRTEHTRSARITGIIQEGVNVRTDPWRLSENSDGENNACTQTTESISFSSSVTIDERPHSINGSWVGIPTEALSQDVQAACAEDVDATVWVAEKYITEQP